MNNIHTKGTYLFRINVVTTVNNETLHKNVVTTVNNKTLHKM
jgi:hypothetical protein